MSEVKLYLGDCIDILPTIKSASVDCVISDPPYPEIDRDYGRITEVNWMAMMQKVVRQSRRILKPTGSAVFILQPNSSKVGSMRPWLYEFQAWCCREWNIIQDVYWWNTTALPMANCGNGRGLLRPAGKPCVWIGESDCYRDQSKILLEPSQSTKTANLEDKFLRHKPSGAHDRHGRMAATALERGGSTPFNVLPIQNSYDPSSAGAHGHGAGTPQALSDWWTRYLCPPGGTVLDPFTGSGTMGLSALKYGCKFIGIERYEQHFNTASHRLLSAEREVTGQPKQLTGHESDLADMPLFAQP